MLQLYLVIQGKVQLEHSSHIVNVGVEATCWHVKPRHILKETTKSAGPFGTMPQEPWRPGNDAKPDRIIQLNCGEVFFKIKTTQSSKYLYEFIPSKSHIYSTLNSENVENYYCRTDQFKYAFFPYSVIECNKLDINLHNANFFLIFRNSSLKIGRPM